MSENNIDMLLGQIIGKLDCVIEEQEVLKKEVAQLHKDMESLRTDDASLDHRVTLYISNAKAYMAGMASIFTLLGSLFGAAFTWWFGR